VEPQESRVEAPIPSRRGKNRGILTEPQPLPDGDAFHYQTANATAQSKSDYNATRGSLTFWPGETRRTIALWIRSDRKREGAETFTVRLSNATGAVIEDPVGMVTILDDVRTR
jgi:chitinase